MKNPRRKSRYELTLETHAGHASHEARKWATCNILSAKNKVFQVEPCTKFMSVDKKQNTGWIWKLTKNEIISELEKRGVPFDINDLRDDLRALLVQVAKDEKEPLQTLENRKIEATAGPENVPNASVIQAANIPQTGLAEAKVEPNVNIEPESNVNSDEQEESFESAHDSHAESTMSDSTKISFSLGKDKWNTLVERLEFQFLSRDVTDDKKKAATLLTSMNEEAFELMRDLCAPNKLGDKKFTELIH